MEEIDQSQALMGQGQRPGTIADQLGVDRETVRKNRAQEDFSPPPPTGAIRPSKLDMSRAVIAGWLEEDALAWHKQRHTAQRIHDRVGTEYRGNYHGSYPSCSGT